MRVWVSHWTRGNRPYYLWLYERGWVKSITFPVFILVMAAQICSMPCIHASMDIRQGHIWCHNSNYCSDSVKKKSPKMQEKSEKLSGVSYVPKLGVNAMLELKLLRFLQGYVPSSVNLRPQCCEICVR